MTQPPQALRHTQGMAGSEAAPEKKRWTSGRVWHIGVRSSSAAENGGRPWQGTIRDGGGRGRALRVPISAAGAAA